MTRRSAPGTARAPGRARARPLLLLAPTLVATAMAADDTAATLWRDRAWSFDWDERLAAQEDGSLFPGFGRHPRRVAPGAWGGTEVSALVAGRARAAYAPGMAPVYDGGQGRVLAEGDAAYGHAFLSLRPELLVATKSDGERVPNGDARQVWTGADPDHRYPMLAPIPRLTVGVWGAGHVLAASNEPVDWGDGVFSGAVLGRAWRGFPHLLLAPLEPWTLGDSDIAIDYQLIGGVLDDSRPTSGDPWLAAYRLAARWRWLTIAGSVATQAGGGDGGDGARLLSPAAGEDIADADGNRMMALDLRLTPWSPLAVVGEYAIDDLGGDERPPLHPHGGAWLAGFDWLDLTGAQDWRLACEWSRAESVYGYHPRYAWDYRALPLGLPEGGNSSALRVLLQHQLDDGDSAALLLAWEVRGWRNAADANAVGTQPAALQTPGGPLLAPTDWHTVSATLHIEVAVIADGTLLIDLAGYYDIGRGFVRGDDGFDGAAGLGWRHAW